MTISKYKTELEDTVFADPYADAFTIISEEHRMIHDGYMFSFSNTVSALANAASHDILIQCATGVIIHIVNVEYSIDDSPALLQLYEGTTFSAAGTGITMFNHSRLSSNTCDATVTHTPTVTSPGTLYHTRYLPDPGGPAGQSSGGIIAGGDLEMVIGNNDNYLFRFTNNSGAAIDVGYHFHAYQIGATP